MLRSSADPCHDTRRFEGSLFRVVFAHIAGVPVEETLLGFGPALVAAVSVGLVHIRSLRDRSFGDRGEQSVADGEDDDQVG